MQRNERFLLLKNKEWKQMTTISLVFPDGASKSFPSGTTGEEVAGSISPGLRRQALAIKLDGELLDLRRELTVDGAIEIITYRDAEGIDVMRHSTAHVLAQAVNRLYKEDRSEELTSVLKS